MTESLLLWYDQNARVLPWRGIHDPYKTWVSEIMLQQTRVDTVIPYFEHFLSVFPDLTTLANAPLEEVLKCWEGLGYYRRARNLQDGAKQVMEQYNGIIPSDPVLLQKIKGIGKYTSGAIASIAFDRPVTAVDGNVIRVFSRFFGIYEDMSTKEALDLVEKLDLEHMDQKRPGDYNQAIMDLGATVCVPGTPDCHLCPLREECKACAGGNADQLPILPGKPQPRQIFYDLFLILSPDGVLMRRRTEKMLEGLWLFPLLPSTDDPEAALKKELKIIPEDDMIFLGEGRHVFTHQVWNMKIHMLCSCSSAPKGYSYIPLSDLSTLTIPSAMRVPLKYLNSDK